MENLNTLVSYFDVGDKTKVISKERQMVVGILCITPEEVLREIFPDYYVVRYLGEKIYSKSQFDNHNDGLVIETFPFEGFDPDKFDNLENLMLTNYFQRCRHDKFSKSERKTVYERVEKQLNYKEKITLELASKYSSIFGVLGFSKSAEEILKDRENSYKPEEHIILNQFKLPSIRTFDG